MRILFVLLAAFSLTGCAGMEFVAVDYHSGHNYGPYVQPVGHISYTLGYYSGSYYNGYQVFGSHGHRYYHAPRNYSHHRHYSRPVVVHQHVHTSICYARGGHSYVTPRPRHQPPVYVRNDHRNERRHDNSNERRTPPRATPPQVRNDRRTPPRATPPQQRDKRVKRQDREDRSDRRRDQERKRK